VTPVSRLSRFSLSLALAGVAVVAAAVVASAYTPPGSALGVTQGCATVSAASSCAVTFQLKDAGGNPVSGATVTFTVSGVPGASVNPTTGVTDPGFVSTTFFAGSTGCGTATVTASTVTGNSGPSASAQTAINVPCTGANGGLPNTSTVPPSAPSWLAALVALALLTVAGCGLALRRMRVTS